MHCNFILLEVWIDVNGDKDFDLLKKQYSFLVIAIFIQASMRTWLYMKVFSAITIKTA